MMNVFNQGLVSVDVLISVWPSEGEVDNRGWVTVPAQTSLGWERNSDYGYLAVIRYGSSTYASYVEKDGGPGNVLVSYDDQHGLQIAQNGWKPNLINSNG